MPTAPVFRDPTLQQRYEERGYVAFPLLDGEAVRKVRDEYGSFTIEDVYGVGYRVSLYSAAIETRRRAREFLIDAVFPSLEPFLVDRYPYMATYLVKEPGGRVIPAHQDWTHLDERTHDSLMCWIPLCDVGAENAALGFIEGSHRWFDYLRVFPYMAAQTPVDCHGAKLLDCLTIQPMRAGDVVVFNNRIVHGSRPNATAGARLACSLALHPRGVPLLGYYLRPNARETALRYRADADFYLKYPNPRMVDLYRNGATIEDYAFDEVRYDVPSAAWSDIEAKMQARSPA